MRFEWDARKAAANLRKHGVSFEQATEALADPDAIETYDIEHSTAFEDRFRLIGMSGKGRLLLVAFTRRDETIRIISARKATHGEAEAYIEAQG